MHGEPKYGPDFKHFDYVNPNAPKGGVIRQGVDRGTFNTFNPYTLKGDPAAGLAFLYESLMISPQDEAFSEYGLIAEYRNARGSVLGYLTLDPAPAGMMVSRSQ